jgi:alpha-tubulin suppressor-like RCC1 family protein
MSIIGATRTFCKISAGAAHALAIDRYGRAWGWGIGNTGQLGNNSTLSQTSPVSVLGAVKTFCQISTATHTTAIDRYGRAWAWGFNTSGQLGNNSITSQLTPVSVLGAVKTFCQISAGATHSVAIDKNGRIWAWGSNTSGELGDNSTTSQRTPVSVAGVVKTFCRISAGNSFTIAIDKNGKSWAWGTISNGRLGIGIGNILTPIRVCTL